jgi:Protein of unknown function (DUF2808)
MNRRFRAAIFPIVLGILVIPIDRALAHGNSTHLSRATALPRTAQLMHSGFVNNYLEFHVQERALSQISIDLPSGVSLNKGIEVTDRSGHPLASQVSIGDRQINLVFQSPVPPDTTIKIVLKGIQSPSLSGRTWLYPISIRSIGLNANIPLETARISTYN